MSFGITFQIAGLFQKVGLPFLHVTSALRHTILHPTPSAHADSEADPRLQVRQAELQIDEAANC